MQDNRWYFKTNISEKVIQQVNLLSLLFCCERKERRSVCSVSLTEGGEQREVVGGEGEGDDARQGL